jgi:Carboxypeptidase regulatory-like domain
VIRSILTSLAKVGVVLSLSAVSAQGQSGVISGTISDPIRGVIVNASVNLYSKHEKSEIETNTFGEFEFTGLRRGIYKITVVKGGFETRVIDGLKVSQKEATPPLRIVMTPLPPIISPRYLPHVSYEKKGPKGVQLTGTIRPLVPDTFELGVEWPYISLSEATVELFRLGHDGAIAAQHPDANGEFQFNHLGPGEYQLKASYPGFDDVFFSNVFIKPKGLTKIEIYMKEVGSRPLDD